MRIYIYVPCPRLMPPSNFPRAALLLARAQALRPRLPACPPARAAFQRSLPTSTPMASRTRTPRASRNGHTSWIMSPSQHGHAVRPPYLGSAFLGPPSALFSPWHLQHPQTGHAGPKRSRSRSSRASHVPWAVPPDPMHNGRPFSLTRLVSPRYPSFAKYSHSYSQSIRSPSPHPHLSDAVLNLRSHALSRAYVKPLSARAPAGADPRQDRGDFACLGAHLVVIGDAASRATFSIWTALQHSASWDFDAWAHGCGCVCSSAQRSTTAPLGVSLKRLATVHWIGGAWDGGTKARRGAHGSTEGGWRDEQRKREMEMTCGKGYEWNSEKRTAEAQVEAEAKKPGSVRSWFEVGAGHRRNESQKTGDNIKKKRNPSGRRAYDHGVGGSACKVATIGCMIAHLVAYEKEKTQDIEERCEMLFDIKHGENIEKMNMGLLDQCGDLKVASQKNADRTQGHTMTMGNVER
ncbi:hypothetical protein EVG20_g7226 [Dentipellis fragilis]|uniref:Uncharacterized protein n=1 Tax=Dentipellis fragilis TaxID=205917 RepID=A0A4Y9YGK1_9AGAM|nr:hypothetical protein EVG20_g7226 [Dentipellis fragilis]